MMHIAVYNKDADEAGLIMAALRDRGHLCQHRELRDLPQAVDGCAVAVADLVHARALLPVLSEARARGVRLPLLLTVEADERKDIAGLLEAGADDYVMRPLRRSELPLRVEILLARFQPDAHAARTETYGAYVFELSDRQVSINGRLVPLTQKEFELALLFFRHLGQPLSRAYLQETIWQEQEETGRSVDTHVSRVRTKLAIRPENGYRLTPVYSFGYRLEQLGG